MKGIILAGGTGTRLHPITKGVCKQMLPVYDKPMIYYPLSVLMLSGIKDILIISRHNDVPRFKDLFAAGKELGIKISYAVQEKPRGIADAFLVGAKFIGKSPVCLILGDNIFYGGNLAVHLRQAKQNKEGATVFAYYINDPQRYGVVEFDREQKVLSIEEKPRNPKSHWVITGLYYYDNDVVRIAKKLKPSKRRELEITDVNREYLKRKKLHVQPLGRGYAWLDTGTYDSLTDASNFIKTIEARQGLKIGCIEEVAFRMGYITKTRLKKLAAQIKTSYGDYLLKIIKES